MISKGKMIQNVTKRKVYILGGAGKVYLDDQHMRLTDQDNNVVQYFSYPDFIEYADAEYIDHVLIGYISQVTNYIWSCSNQMFIQKDEYKTLIGSK